MLVACVANVACEQALLGVGDGRGKEDFLPPPTPKRACSQAIANVSLGFCEVFAVWPRGNWNESKKKGKRRCYFFFALMAPNFRAVKQEKTHKTLVTQAMILVAPWKFNVLKISSIMKHSPWKLRLLIKIPRGKYQQSLLTKTLYCSNLTCFILFVYCHFYPFHSNKHILSVLCPILSSRKNPGLFSDDRLQGTTLARTLMRSESGSSALKSAQVTGSKHDGTVKLNGWCRKRITTT